MMSYAVVALALFLGGSSLAGEPADTGTPSPEAAGPKYAAGELDTIERDIALTARVADLERRVHSEHLTAKIDNAEWLDRMSKRIDAIDAARLDPGFWSTYGSFITGLFGASLTLLPALLTFVGALYKSWSEDTAAKRDKDLAEAKHRHDAAVAMQAQKHTMMVDLLDRALNSSASPETRRQVLRFLRLRQSDPELRQWAAEELTELEPRVQQIQELRTEISDLGARLARLEIPVPSGKPVKDKATEEDETRAALAERVARLAFLQAPSRSSEPYRAVQISCPICGGPANARIGTRGGDHAWAQCTECGARFPVHQIHGDEFSVPSVAAHRGFLAESTVEQWLRQVVPSDGVKVERDIDNDGSVDLTVRAGLRRLLVEVVLVTKPTSVRRQVDAALRRVERYSGGGRHLIVVASAALTHDSFLKRLGPDITTPTDDQFVALFDLTTKQPAADGELLLRWIREALALPGNSPGTTDH